MNDASDSGPYITPTLTAPAVLPTRSKPSAASLSADIMALRNNVAALKSRMESNCDHLERAIKMLDACEAQRIAQNILIERTLGDCNIRTEIRSLTREKEHHRRELSDRESQLRDELNVRLEEIDGEMATLRRRLSTPTDPLDGVLARPATPTSPTRSPALSLSHDNEAISDVEASPSGEGGPDGGITASPPISNTPETGSAKRKR